MRAITGAVHSAAGNRAGARAAQKFRFHAAKPVEIPTAKAQSLFAVDPAQGLITEDQIAAEVARMKAEQ